MKSARRADELQLRCSCMKYDGWGLLFDTPTQVASI